MITAPVARSGGDRDAHQQPEARAGVEHLAQLDADDAACTGWGVRRARSTAATCSRVGGAHAAAPSRWTRSRWSAVSSRNISSRPAPSASRSSVRAMPAAWATAPTRSGSAGVQDRAVRGDGGARCRRPPGRCARSWAAWLRTTVPAARSSSAFVPCATMRPLPITTRSSAIDLDLVQEVRGEQHRAALVGVGAQQVAHPADAGRVETVGRLVEDQHRGVADQRGRDAEPLAHAERVVAHPALRLVLGEADPLQHPPDAVAGQAHRAGGDGEDLPAGASRVLGRGVEQDTDLAAGVGQVGVATAVDRSTVPDVGGVRPTMTRMVVDLPAPLGPRKPVTRPAGGGERDVVDGGEPAVPLGE